MNFKHMVNCEWDTIWWNKMQVSSFHFNNSCFWEIIIFFYQQVSNQQKTLTRIKWQDFSFKYCQTSHFIIFYTSLKKTYLKRLCHTCSNLLISNASSNVPLKIYSRNKRITYLSFHFMYITVMQYRMFSVLTIHTVYMLV